MWVAIDLSYGKPMAYAGVEHETVVFVKTTAHTGQRAVEEIQAYVRDALRYGTIITGLVWEKPYHKRNPEVFRRLAHMSGQFHQFCQEHGLQYRQIMPSHWKRSYLRKTGLRARSKAGQAFLTRLASHYIGRNNFTVDERDAVLIGLYVNRREREG